MFRKIKGCITRLPRAKYSFILTLLTFFRNLKFIVMKNSWAWYAFLIPFLTHVLWGVSAFRDNQIAGPRGALCCLSLYLIFCDNFHIQHQKISLQWHFIKISHYQQLSSHCYSSSIKIHNLWSTRVYEFLIYNYSGNSFVKCTCKQLVNPINDKIISQ